MSGDSAPIAPARFAEALKDLSIGSLHSKAAELRNSINHLKSSNEQIRDYLLSQPPDAPADADCVEAIQENVQVIKRMEERIDLVKVEVQERGLPWPDEDHLPQSGHPDQQEPGEARVDGQTNGDHVPSTGATSSSNALRSQQQSGRLTDEQLAQRLRERLGEPDDTDEDESGGLHL